LFIEILNCIPARITAYHICTGSGKSAANLLLPVLKQMAGKEFRLRLHLHVSHVLYLLLERRGLYVWFEPMNLTFCASLCLCVYDNIYDLLYRRRVRIAKFYCAWEILVWVWSMVWQCTGMRCGIWNCIENGWKNGERSSGKVKLWIERDRARAWHKRHTPLAALRP
jgi:hypothetical protein